MKKGFKPIMFLMFILILSSFAFATDFTTDNVGWWTLNESLTDGVVDESPNGNDLTNNGATYDATDDAFDFDGTDDYLISSNDVFSTATAQTISFWIKPDFPSSHTSNTYYFFDTVLLANRYALNLYRNTGMNVFKGTTAVFTNIDPTIWWSTTEFKLITIVFESGASKFYVNGDLKYSSTVTFTPTTAKLRLGGKYDGSNDYGGKMSGVSIFDKALTSTEVAELSAEGRDFNAYDVEPVVNATIRIEELYQITQGDIVTITSDDAWTTIFNWDYALDVNYTNYGSTTIQTLSNTINTNFSCRTLINGTPTGDDVNRTNIAGEIGSLTVLRPDVTVAGSYDGEVQCKKTGGDTFIGFSNGVGHIFNSSSVYSFSVENEFFINGTNELMESVLVNSTYDGYLVLESGGTISSDYAQVYELFFNTSDGQSCGVNYRELAGGDEGAIGGVCVFKVEEGVEINVSAWATGNELTLDSLTHAKILSFANSTELYTVNVTDTQTLIGRVLVNNTQRLDKVFMKANIPIQDSTQTINVQFAVDGVLVGQEVPYTAGDLIKQSIQQFIADAPDQDLFNVSLYATSVTTPITDIEVKGGNFLAYVGDEYAINSTYVTITADNLWNGSSITNFSVSDGTTQYTTDDGSINIFTSETILNLTFSADGYLDKSYTDHNVSNDLEGELYQSITTVDLSTFYYESQINGFSVHTEKGTFNTNGSVVTLYPNLGSYIWNVTTDNFYNKSNLTFIVDSSLTSITQSNFTNALVRFMDSANGTPMVNASIGVGISSKGLAKFNLTTDSDGYIEFAGFLLSTHFENYSYAVTLNSYQGYISPITFSNSSYSTPINTTYNISRTHIIVNVYDRDTGVYLNQLAYVDLQGLIKGNTSTGVFDYDNLSISAGTFTLVVSSEGYQTEQKTLTYTSQATLNVSVFLLNQTNADATTLTVRTIDGIKRLLAGVTVTLEEYDTTTQSYSEVSECITNSDAECKFLIEANTKSYILKATLVSNGETLYVETDPEIFQSDIVGGEEVIFSELSRTLILVSSVSFDTSPIYYLTYDITENYNDVTNTSQISVDFATTDGHTTKICVDYYKLVGGVKQALTNGLWCVEGASGTAIPTTHFTLNSSYTYRVDVYQEENDVKTILQSFTYKGDDSLQSLLDGYAILYPFMIFLWVGIIALGFLTKNMVLTGILAIVLSWVEFALFPNAVIVSVSALKTIIAIIFIYNARKKEDFN